MWRAGILLAGLAACASPPKYFGKPGCEALAREAGHELWGTGESHPIAHTNVRIVTWMPVNGRPGAECTLRGDRIEAMWVGLEDLTPDLE